MLSSHGIEIETFEIVAQDRALRKRVKKAVARGVALLIIGGGDGAMATAVDGLANTATVLGVLPLGTGNSFAKTLAIPSDVVRAVEIIAAGRATHVDLGTANGKHFANFATVGLSAEIAENASHALKAVIGAAAYVAAGFGPFLSSRPFRAKIAYDGAKLVVSTQQMVIASGRYFGSHPVTPDASIRDGRLAFFTTTGVSRLAVARMYVAFALGLQNRLPDAYSLSAREISIRTSSRQAVSIDGNPFGTTPVRFGIAPRALRVMVPSEFADAVE